MAAIAVISQAQQTTVNVETAGTLSEQIGSDKYTITSLKITGNLNGTDFILLRDMAGIDLDNVPTEGKLATLDLSEAAAGVTGTITQILKISVDVEGVYEIGEYTVQVNIDR